MKTLCNWVPTTYCWGVTLRWTSILSREGDSILHAKETRKSSGRLDLYLLPFICCYEKKIDDNDNDDDTKITNAIKIFTARHVNERELKFLPLSQPCVHAVTSRKVIGKSERDNP